jgi:hypothetical protein
MAEAVDQWLYPQGDSGQFESFMQRLIVSSCLTQEVFNQESFNSGVR